MKKIGAILFAIVACVSSCTCANTEATQESQKMLRHIVLFSFNEDLSAEGVREIETAFAELPSQITEIKAFEWGTEVNPEKAFTHCFVVSFASEDDFNTYRVHPAHLKFGEMVKGRAKAVSSVDYWEK
jgi:hypothetical protein